MKSLDTIKRRIGSVKTTSKITGAMKLVATAKIKRQMTDFKNVSSFCKEFYQIIEDVVKTIPPEVEDKNADKNKPKL
jgi:F-type H+-transporting ATPase subunit gamma